MPAIYAHDSFGGIVLKKLNDENSVVIRKYLKQYRIGLQGPDFLFFYKPLSKNNVNQLGYRIHEESAKGFMEHAAEVVRELGKDTPEYAYILGVICHFALDSECHGYVDEMIKKTTVGHIELESEFEKYLLKRAKHEPLSYPIGKLVPTDALTANAMQSFYEDINAEAVQKALQDMRKYKTILVAPSRVKQLVIRAAFKISGKYDSLQGHLLKPLDNPRCVASNNGLWERYKKAINVAVFLMEKFEAYVDGRETLDERFDRNFE